MHAVGPVLIWRDRVFAQPGRQPASFDDLQASSVCANGLSTVIDGEWPVYLGILKTEAVLIEAAEAFFATYTIDVEAMLPKLPPPETSVATSLCQGCR